MGKRPETLPSWKEIIAISEVHYRLYSEAKKKITSTHRMILFYAVECRLKGNFYKAFKREIDKESGIYYKLAMSHQLDILLKELKLPNVGTCPNVELEKESKKYDIEIAHSCWRYGYAIEDKSEKALVSWLKGVYKKLKKSGYR